MRRDGQFYLIDAFFAAAIVFIGIGFLVSDFVSAPQSEQARVASLDIVSLLFDQPLSQITHQYTRQNAGVLELQLSPIDQVHVWYTQSESEGCTDCFENATHLLGNLTTQLLPNQHGLSISINNVTLYSVGHENPILLVNTRRMVYTLYEDVLYGPSLVEVKVWV